MEIRKVEPYGYCAGVTRAMKLASEAAKAHGSKDLYALGMPVHNEDAVAELEAEGIIVLDEREAPLEEQLRAIPDGSAVLFSAHGHPRSFDEIAKSKSLLVFDATCPFVQEVEEEGDSSKSVLYLGVEGHLECVAFLANHPSAGFYDVIGKKLVKDPLGLSPLILSQTTLSSAEIEAARSLLLARFPGAHFGKLRCNATSLRQAAVSAIPSSYTTILVLGSSRSNNSKKLAELASTPGRTVYFARNLEEVKAIPFAPNEKLALVSGASTSRQTVDSVEEYLRSIK